MVLRKFLVVAQFCVSIILVITIILLYRQLRFFINADYGFRMENVLNVEMRGNKQERLAAEFSYIPEIQNIAWSSLIPGAGSRKSDRAWLNNKEEQLSLAYFAVDPNYIEVLDLNLLAGDNFPEASMKGMEKYIILNETAVEVFNFPGIEEALGKVITIEDTILVEVIGVVEDYHFFNMFTQIGPMGLRLIPGDYRYAHLQVSSPDIDKTIRKIEMAWKEVDPEHKMQATFTDDEIREYYLYFGDILYMIGFASMLAIVIACMGLFGMAAYSSRSRIKEIGIRKVFGARSSSIALMVSGSYIRLILISLVIALPVTWFGNNLWLQNFPYKVSFGFGTLITGTLLILLVSFFSVISQTLQAARQDPVVSLRHE
jgi:putative ABC transport system permease protein